MVGITENLAREELSNEEKQAQTALYAGLLKKHGLVADADALRSETQKRTGDGGRPGGREPKLSAHVPKLTVTQAVAKDLGVDADTVRYRLKQARDLARAAGLEVPEGATPETLPAGMLIEIAKTAATAALIKQNSRQCQPKEFADLEACFAAQKAKRLLFPFKRWEELPMGRRFNASRKGDKWTLWLGGFDGPGSRPGAGYSERQALGKAAGNVLRALARKYDKGELFMNSDKLVPLLIYLDGRQLPTEISQSGAPAES